MNHPFWLFLERCVYRIPDPPPRVRTKPMQVLCVGFSRSGTESLQHALITLGYDHTYHGWDISFESPLRIKAWVRLCRKKWFGSEDGDVKITAAEFDEVLGHAVAVTDLPGSCFATELIEAYPDAKVILNVREMDAWHRSAVKSLVQGVNENWMIIIMCWFNAELWWTWHIYWRFMVHRLFRCTDSGVRSGVVRNGKWIYRGE